MFCLLIYLSIRFACILSSLEFLINKKLNYHKTKHSLHTNFRFRWPSSWKEWNYYWLTFLRANRHTRVHPKVSSQVTILFILVMAGVFLGSPHIFLETIVVWEGILLLDMLEMRQFQNLSANLMARTRH